MRIKTLLITLFAFTLGTYSFSQQNELQKIYTPFFKFEDGIYQSFAEFKFNKPNIKPLNVYNENKQPEPTLWTSGEINLFHKTDSSTKKINRAWGFCLDNKINVNYQGEFYRLMEIGSLCHFAAKQYVSSFDPYYGYYQVDSGIQQFILDFENGNVYPFTLKNFTIAIENDKELYDDFRALKPKKEQRKMMFLYLKKYNERHPVYFPTTL